MQHDDSPEPEPVHVHKSIFLLDYPHHTRGYQQTPVLRGIDHCLCLPQLPPDFPRKDINCTAEHIESVGRWGDKDSDTWQEGNNLCSFSKFESMVHVLD